MVSLESSRSACRAAGRSPTETSGSRPQTFFSPANPAFGKLGLKWQPSLRNAWVAAAVGATHARAMMKTNGAFDCGNANCGTSHLQRPTTALAPGLPYAHDLSTDTGTNNDSGNMRPPRHTEAGTQASIPRMKEYHKFPIDSDPMILPRLGVTPTPSWSSSKPGCFEPHPGRFESS